MEKGMASPTRRAFLIPRAMKRTATTRIRPEIILFSRSATMALISLDLFMSLVMVVFWGKPRLAFSTMASIFSEIKMMFSPTRFFTEIVMESTPLSRDLEVSSFIPSTTAATSFK